MKLLFQHSLSSYAQGSYTTMSDFAKKKSVKYGIVKISCVASIQGFWTRYHTFGGIPFDFFASFIQFKNIGIFLWFSSFFFEKVNFGRKLTRSMSTQW